MSGKLAIAVILVVLGVVWPTRRVQPLALFDQQFYLGIAADLHDHGRFTDGYQFAQAEPDGLHPPGMRFAPLYPTLLAGLATVDPTFRASMACVVQSEGHDAACSRAAPLIRTLQVALLAATLWLTWWMASAIAGALTGALALALTLLAAQFLLDTANWLMTETLALALTTAATAAATRGTLQPRRRAAAWALAGALLGFAVLTKPAFLYLSAACLAVGAALTLRKHQHRTAFTGFALCLAAVLAPWLVRNALVMHRLALTYGYDSHTLVQRLSFNAMSGREYRLSFVCWLPDGNALGRSLAGPGACDRFGWSDRPDTFYAIGIGPMLLDTLRKAGGYDHHLGYLLATYVWPHPLWHAAVSLPLALRGAWIDRYWGVALAPLCLWRTILAARRAWRGAAAEAAFLAVALPGWFMLAFNAAVAVNQPRYNLMLVPAYGLAGGLALRWVLGRLLSSAAPAAGPWWPAPAPPHRRTAPGRGTARGIPAPPTPDPGAG